MSADRHQLKIIKLLFIEIIYKHKYNLYLIKTKNVFINYWNTNTNTKNLFIANLIDIQFENYGIYIYIFIFKLITMYIVSLE